MSDESRLDPAVVSDLFAEHGEELRRFLIGVLKDRQLAHDAMQSALAKLVEQGQNTAESSRKAWLFRVALNEAYAVRRREATGSEVVRRLAWQRELAHPASDEPLLQRETVQRVQDALKELPQEQQDVVRRRIYENQTFAVIAKELNIPLGTALSRMRMALEKLRAKLDDD